MQGMYSPSATGPACSRVGMSWNYMLGSCLQVRIYLSTCNHHAVDGLDAVPTVTEKLQAALFADVSTAVQTTALVVLGKNVDPEAGSHEDDVTSTLSVSWVA